MLQAKPEKMPIISGLRSTLTSVLPMPFQEKLPLCAHSTETVTSVHRIRLLNTSTSATEARLACPRRITATGIPSMTLLEKIPPRPNTDAEMASRPNTLFATMRPTI